MSSRSKGFIKAVEIILDLEGQGKLITDSGGLTKWGISQRAFPDTDIKTLTKEQARGIYYKEYWKAVEADYFAWPLSLYVFDAAVNQGQTTAIRMLQKAIGTRVDGDFGPNSKQALSETFPGEACALFLAKRAVRYSRTNNYDKYGYGWFARLFRIVNKSR